DVAGVVDGACESLYQMALKKGVELTLFTDPAIPSQVMGDAGRLRQILVNLASNAIKFSSGQDRPGKVSVRVVLVERTPDEHGRFPLLNPLPKIPSPQSSPAGGRGSEREIQLSIPESLRDAKQILLEFRVTDNGIGIDKKTQARLFTPFTQADTSTTRAYGGTGLGLVISRRLTNIMGGDVAIQSEPGKGSIFSTRLTFDLPPEQPVAGEVSSLVTGLSCLVVGGKESLADDLAAYLAHDGAAVERAEDLTAAQLWVARRPSGLCAVIIDTAGAHLPLATPLLDGLRVAARAGAGVDARFVTIERGGRRRCRIMATDLVALDAEVMHRRAFLEAVAIAAGRAKQPDLEERYGDARITPPLSREEARHRGSLILVAEDNEINQKVILQQLMLLGRTADIANNGCEALELWRNDDYAILLADLHMPEMDGYELTAAIRAAETDAGATGKPRIPIVAFTANALKGEAERCRAIGMDDYLSKPVQLADLKAMLEKWLPVVSSDPIQEKTALTSENSSTGSIPIPPPTPPLKGGECASGYAFHPPLQGEGWGGDGSNSAGKRSGVTSTPTATPVPVDVNVLKALVGDDEAMIREFLHDFRPSAEKIAAELHAACAAGETATAGTLAHKLKSSSRSIGALALGELCAAMEKAGKDGDTAELAALLPQFEQELAGVEDFLEGR
ncbi:MAG: ATP-binding protein, partial [Gallionella sp.]|nr:ATP-binding protein [Gallionella sp.]